MTGPELAGLTELYCSDCGEVQPFVTPPCEDGHDSYAAHDAQADDCPDLCCTVCGLALTRGVPPAAVEAAHVPAA